jgi:hypothetical protein
LSSASSSGPSHTNATRRPESLIAAPQQSSSAGAPVLPLRRLTSVTVPVSVSLTYTP